MSVVQKQGQAEINSFKMIFKNIYHIYVYIYTHIYTHITTQAPNHFKYCLSAADLISLLDLCTEDCNF